MLLFIRNTFTCIRHTETHLTLVFQCIGKCNRALGSKFLGIGQEVREYLYNSIFISINHDLW